MNGIYHSLFYYFFTYYNIYDSIKKVGLYYYNINIVKNIDFEFSAEISAVGFSKLKKVFLDNAFIAVCLYPALIYSKNIYFGLSYGREKFIENQPLF